MMRRIAVACAEDGSISRHFGQTSHFEVFCVEDGQITSLEVVRNTPRHGGQHRHGAPGTAAAGHHGHLSLLNGCNVVLCGGMGQGAASSLTAAGSQPVIVEGVEVPRAAVEEYLAGTLRTGAVHACCGHGHQHRHGVA